MENLRNRINVKLVSNKKDYLKWTSKPSYMSHKIFDNDLVAIRKNKVTLTLNKPAYIGMCILKLSKILMCEFHYIILKINMLITQDLFTDTDSLMNEIKTEDVYKDFNNHKEMFDFSNYSKKSKYYDNSKKLKVDEFKDEAAGVTIEEFVGIKPKLYSYLLDDNSEHKKAKGVHKNVVPLALLTSFRLARTQDMLLPNVVLYLCLYI